jgi:hypothetical protein
MTAPGYVHGRSADEGETDTREFVVLFFFLFVSLETSLILTD